MNPHPSQVSQPATLTCHKCGFVVDPPFEDAFYRDANGPHGWRKWCKACYSEAPSIVRRNAERSGEVTS